MTQPQYVPQQPQYVPQQPQYGPPPVPLGQPVYAPPPPQQQYAQPAYQAPYTPPPPAAPVINASIEDFLGQPHTGGGISLNFGDKPNGYAVTGRVSRRITRADIQVQTDTVTKQPQFYKDGRPKLVMLVPLDVQPTQENPEGKATWWVKGNSRDELAAGMARAGSKEEVPEEGATVVITKTGSRPIQGRTPQVLYRVDYYPPAGAAPAPQAQPEVQAPAQPAPLNGQGFAAYATYVPDNGLVPQPDPTQYAQQAAPMPAAATGPAPSAYTPPATASSEPVQPPAAPPAPPQAAPQAPAGPQPTPAQQMLLNQLANGGQPPAQG